MFVPPSIPGPEEYHFVNQGDCYDLRQVEDEDEFVETKQALKVGHMNWFAKEHGIVAA